MRNIKVNILELCEIRMFGNGLVHSDYYVIVCSGANKHEMGVGKLLGRERSKTVKESSSASEIKRQRNRY